MQRLRSFGGVDQIKELHRDGRGVPVVETTLQDLRFAIRVLRRSPVYTTVEVLTLAIGIGANTAIFSLVDAVLIMLLPVRNPEQLVAIETFSQRGERTNFAYRHSNGARRAARERALDGVARHFAVSDHRCGHRYTHSSCCDSVYFRPALRSHANGSDQRFDGGRNSSS